MRTVAAAAAIVLLLALAVVAVTAAAPSRPCVAGVAYETGSCEEGEKKK